MAHTIEACYKKVEAVTAELSRLQAQKARERITLDKQSQTERRSRTRTLIQLGGLTKVSGLLELFDIEMGDDLELDATKSDQAAMLLGCFITVCEQMPVVVSLQDKEIFKQKGIRALKMRSYTKHR